MAIALPNNVSRLQVRHLMLLSLLVEYGSVRNAAAHMHLTQPAVSRLLSDLESAFNAKLFERTPRGITPYPKALALLRRSQVALSELRLGLTEMADSPSRPLIRIGTSPHVMRGLVPIVANMVEMTLPTLRLSLQTAPSEDLFASLLNGDLDCIVARLPLSSREGKEQAKIRMIAKELHYEVLYEEPQCVVVRKGHRLARRRQVAWSEMEGARWLLPATGGLAIRPLTDAFLRCGLQVPEASVVCEHFVFGIPIVAETDLLMVVPLTEAKRHSSTLTVLRMSEPLVSPPVVLATRVASLALAYLPNILDFFRDAVERREKVR